MKRVKEYKVGDCFEGVATKCLYRIIGIKPDEHYPESRDSDHILCEMIIVSIPNEVHYRYEDNLRSWVDSMMKPISEQKFTEQIRLGVETLSGYYIRKQAEQIAIQL